MDEHRIREIYQISLDTNRATFTEGEYDIAYHLLLVALQCAQRLRDADYLTEISRLAEKESRFIDDHHPEYAFPAKPLFGAVVRAFFKRRHRKQGQYLQLKMATLEGVLREQQRLFFKSSAGHVRFDGTRFHGRW